MTKTQLLRSDLSRWGFEDSHRIPSDREAILRSSRGRLAEIFRWSLRPDRDETGSYRMPKVEHQFAVVARWNEFASRPHVRIESGSPDSRRTALPVYVR